MHKFVSAPAMIFIVVTLLITGSCGQPSGPPLPEGPSAAQQVTSEMGSIITSMQMSLKDNGLDGFRGAASDAAEQIESLDTSAIEPGSAGEDALNKLQSLIESRESISAEQAEAQLNELAEALESL